jgi:endonuclease/exonuclease/phosphatase family metal-dependent hydrolase
MKSTVVPALVLLGPVLLASCSSDDSGAGSTPSSNEFTFVTFNVALAGSFVPWEDQRRQPVVDAVAGLDADVVCLQEAWRKSDKDLFEQAARDRFPYSVRFEHNLDTPIDDPADQSGAVPPAPTTAPCEAPQIKAQFESVIDCLVQHCSTIPGSDQGKTTTATCAQDYCLAEAAPLLTGPDEQRCYGCAATSLPVDTLADIRDRCETLPNASLAFNGQSGVMMLSRYPLVDADDWVLPGTWNRRVIIRATAKLPNGVDLDVYCNHLTPIFFDLAFPYTGQYGDGKTGPDGWAAEQSLQVKKLEAYVHQHSGDGRALILGDFNAGHEFRVDGHLVARAEGNDAATLLDDAFDEALTSDYTPACTFCASNPVTGLTGDWESAWIDHIYLHAIGVDAVRSTRRILDDAPVSVTEDDGSGGTRQRKVPVSDHYGMEAVVEIAP